MAGAIFETYVVGEIIKSWWHRAATPRLHYYRDQDKREIDLLMEHDGKIHPLEIKRSATPRKDWLSAFPLLERLGVPVGPGGVICLAQELTPLDRQHWAIPVGAI